MVSAEPERLGIELVNRYHALKRAGTIRIGTVPLTGIEGVAKASATGPEW